MRIVKIQRMTFEKIDLNTFEKKFISAFKNSVRGDRERSFLVETLHCNVCGLCTADKRLNDWSTSILSSTGFINFKLENKQLLAKTT